MHSPCAWTACLGAPAAGAAAAAARPRTPPTAVATPSLPRCRCAEFSADTGLSSAGKHCRRNDHVPREAPGTQPGSRAPVGGTHAPNLHADTAAVDAVAASAAAHAASTAVVSSGAAAQRCLTLPRPALPPAAAAAVAFLTSFADAVRVSKGPQNTCVVCQERGATVRCAHSRCTKLFHLPCCTACKVDAGARRGRPAALAC